MVDIVPIHLVAPASVEALLDRAFGTDRHRRTAYTVRGAARAIAGLSFAAVDGGVLVGSVQCWPVTLTDDAGIAHPLVMIGPVAVAPERQRSGLGRELMDRALAAADHADADTIGAGLMLIGDPEYYGRFFGFTAERTAGWRLPGPVERRRLLARGVPEIEGMLGPVAAVAA